MPNSRRLAFTGIAVASVAVLAALFMLRGRSDVEPLADLAFEDLAGEPAALSDFHGKVVVLNLWATWCQPCREEMPSLGRLQAAFANEPVVVLALSVDRAGPERVASFLRETGVTNLAVYRDPTAAATRALKVPGLPATILVDREGNEAGRVLGIAEWDGPEAQRSVRALLGAPAG